MSRSFFSKTITLWILAVIITLSSVVYQRLTGPSHPKRGSVEIADEKIKYRLLRSHETTSGAPIEIKVPDIEISGEVKLKRFKSHDEWSIIPLERRGDILAFNIPVQPSAGKVIYEVTLMDMAGNKYPLTDEPVIIRYTDSVPRYVLYPHVLFMFVAMLLSTLAGLKALAKSEKIYLYVVLTSILLFAGGMVLGPIVQKYAFGAFWTGWPFGHDLTDNKTAVAMFFWIIALWRGRIEGRGRVWIIIASVVTLLIYLIPHSVLGSEIDYTKADQL